MIRDEIRSRLNELAHSPLGMDGCLLKYYKWYFEREKIIYSTLNLLRNDGIWLKGLCWCQPKKQNDVNSVLTKLREENDVTCSNLIEVTDHSLSPPTHFRTNDFLWPFQEIVQTYGVATYKEINPAIFTIITFPFYFGIMFGDLLHGLVVLFFSFYLCFKRKEILKTKSVLSQFLSARYLLMLMGCFSSFAGIIYNEFGSYPIYIQPSCYDNYDSSTLHYNKSDASCVYPFGFDPIWTTCENFMQFVNSYKMKISVFFGVIHMSLGIALKGINACYHLSPIEFFFEFLPQIIFFVSFFGYMNAMIVIKWVTDWSFVKQEAPALITELINIAFKGGDPGPIPLFGDGTSQQIIHQVILCNFIYLLFIFNRHFVCMHSNSSFS